ncbi:MAG: T9SS C-terminal target domain-containing protein, partial [Bacteroidetes bacterium]|nr:T9SS C-terminal target domain-containing protein [Bacteroidota bacterium]
DRLLIAATFGRGAWTLPLDALPTTTEAGVEKPEAFLLESAFPNPFTDAVRVTWSQPATADVEIEIANVAGQRVMQHTLPMVPAGPQEWTWRPQGIAAGTYLMRVTSSGKTDTRSLVLVR